MYDPSNAIQENSKKLRTVLESERPKRKLPPRFPPIPFALPLPLLQLVLPFPFASLPAPDGFLGTKRCSTRTKPSLVCAMCVSRW